MDFPLYYEKVIWVEGDFLRRNLYLKKPNNPEYSQVLLVMCLKLNSVTIVLSPLSYTVWHKRCTSYRKEDIIGDAE